jgi:hypothetical protein
MTKRKNNNTQKTACRSRKFARAYFELFGKLLVFVYHCFDRIVVNGYLSGLSRPEQAVYFFREVVGVAGVVLRGGPVTIVWVEAFACNHEL